MDDPVCRLDDIEVEGGVAALVDGAAVAVFRTHDGQRVRPVQLRSLLQGVGAGARHRRHARGRPVRGLADAQAGLRPAHRAVPRRRGGPGPDVRRPGRPPASSWSARQREEPVNDRPSRPDRLPHRRHRRPQGRGAGRAAERRGAAVEWAPALSLDPNHVDDAELRAADRGGAEPTGRHVPGDHRHRDEGVVRGRGARGACSTSCWRRSAGGDPGPRAEERRRAAPPRPARAVGAGVRVLRGRARPPARPRPRPACGSWCRSTASRCRWSRTRCAARAPTSPTVTVYRVASRRGPRADVPDDRPDRRPCARRGHLHLRPRRGRADGRRRLDRAPRGGGRRRSRPTWSPPASGR